MNHLDYLGGDPHLGKVLSLDGGLSHGDVMIAAELMVHQELQH